MISNVSLPWWSWAAMGVGLAVFVGLIALTVKRNRGMHRSLFASPYTLWMIIFTVVPVILISYYSFTDSNGNFTLDNFKNFWDSHYEANKVIREEEAFRSGDFTFLTEAGELSEDGTTLTIRISALVTEDGRDASFLTQRGEPLLTIAAEQLHVQEDYSALRNAATLSEDGAAWIIAVADLADLDGHDLSFLTEYGEISESEELLTIADTVLQEIETLRSGDYSFLTEADELSEDGATLAIPVSALITEDGQDLSFLTQRGEISDSLLSIDVARLHEKVDYSQYIKRGTVNWDTLVYSLWMAFLCTVICLLLGYPAALFMADRKMKLGATLVVLFIIPMWMNFLLRTVAWMSLLEDSGLINSLLRSLGLGSVQMMYTSNTVLLGMVYNYLPFMVFPIYTVLNKMDYRLSEAAADLGCNSFQTLYKVTVPLSVPGIVSGITMVFMPSVTTFFIPRVLGGGYTMMFGDLIESKFLTEGNWNAGSALSLLMMLLILASLSILRKVDPNGEGGGLA